MFLKRSMQGKGNGKVLKGPLRVVSFLPSATENFFSLLNYAQTKYSVPCRSTTGTTGSSSSNSSSTIDSSRRNLPILVGCSKPHPSFQELSDYHSSIQQFHPDVILCKQNETNKQISVEQLNAKIVSFDTMKISMKQILVDDFLLLGEAIGLKEEAKEFIRFNLQQLDKFKQQQQQQAANAKSSLSSSFSSLSMNKPTRVMLIEGLDPLLIVDPNMQSWKKEMIEFVGGQLVDKMTCQQQEEEDFVVILSLYGLDIKQTKQELQHVLSQQEQEEFTQFLNSQKKSPFVYLMDGTSSIFSCPTPQRLLETIQWLIQILYGISHKEEEEIDTSSIAHKFLSLPRSRTSTSCSSQMMKEIEELHHLACINKESMYKDPKTGYSVLTSFYLQQHGICCGNGCRHCPYGHVNVKDPTRQQNQLKKPMLIHPKPIQVGSNTTNKTTTLIRPSRFWFDGTTDSTTDTDGTGTTGSIDNFWIMFWSGGKKSFLALSEFVQTISSRTNSCLILLTTIDPETRMVPIQNISMKTILQQAKHMDLPVCMVPIPQGSSNQVYTDHVFEALDTIFHSQQHDQAVVNLIFGDLHVQEIRMWREQVFDSFHQKVHLHFPLWQKDVASELLPMLERICQVKKVSIQFTTDVLALNVKQGDVFDSRQILNRQKSKAGITGSIDDTGKLMNKTIDLMGESHTCIHFHF